MTDTRTDNTAEPLFDKLSSDIVRKPRLNRFLGGAEEYTALKELGEEIIVPEGTLIAAKGIVPECCYIVLKGAVVSSDVAFADSERIHFINANNSLLLEANCLLNRPLEVSFIASKQTHLVRITKEDLLKALNDDHCAAEELVYSLSYKFLSAMDQINELDCHSSYWKVCNLLIGLADMFGKPSGNKIIIMEKYSQRLMATILGLNRGTVLKTIKDLKERGIIDQIDGRYCIRSRSRLEQIMTEMDMKV